MSFLTLRVTGLDRLETKLAQRRDLANTLIPALRDAGDMTRNAAYLRIKRGGTPRWKPSQRVIRFGGTTGILTGTMVGSIAAGQPHVARGQGSVSVGISGTAAKYASRFQFGSASRSGARGVAKSFRNTKIQNRNVQQWSIGRQTFTQRTLSVINRGQVARPFLYFDDVLKKRIVDAFRKHMSGESR